jgi:hypothetical protein
VDGGLLRFGCLGLRTRKFAISASIDAAPAAVKAAQSAPVMLVSRLTINVARKSLRTENDTSEKCQRRIFSENAERVTLRFRRDGVAGGTVFLQGRSACWNN